VTVTFSLECKALGGTFPV